ncbi:hypothetical protein [Pseudodesulfovibrio methanolicus]|uniref:Uncharacterized protein n=1 Tax=Pseudodesulfovibrio methanolicus TaxID=3126690 RepID=A0ABZ2J508_9BACT
MTIQFQQNLNDYKSALHTLIKVWDVNKGQDTGRIKIWGDFESLTSKIILQAVSALKLYTDNKFVVYKDRLILSCDFTSINVISRSVLEAYLYTWWLFVDVKSESEREYKILCWRIAAMNFRLSFSPITEEGRRVLESERTQLDGALDRLKNNTFYNSLCDVEKNKILNKINNGSNVRPGWKKIIEDAKLSKGFADTYSYMCDSSHSGQLSSLQIYSAHGDVAQQKRLCRVALNTILMCICRLVRDYSELWELSKEYLILHSGELAIIKKWCEIAESPWS